MQSFFQYRRLGQDVGNAHIFDGQASKMDEAPGTALQGNPGIVGRNNAAESGEGPTSEWIASNHGGSDQENNFPKPLIVDFMRPWDPENPQDWTFGYKWMITAIVGSAGFVVSGASAIDSEITPQLMEDFCVGQEVALLGTTLFMVAFGLGSLISAPFSEVVGRNPVYIVSEYPCQTRSHIARLQLNRST